VLGGARLVHLGASNLLRSISILSQDEFFDIEEAPQPRFACVPNNDKPVELEQQEVQNLLTTLEPIHDVQTPVRWI
ncbi:hypothetical protein AVEN_217579-1, partial [Araneus ventricosus]